MADRIPRSVLLPPYLLMNDYFIEYSDAVDAIFKEMVDDKTFVVRNLRNMWVKNDVIDDKIEHHEMIDLQDWSIPERDLLVSQVNLLGMKLKSAGVLTNDDYLLVSRFVGQYWFGKGTQAFVEFINFCLNADLRVYNLWAEDQGDEEYHNLSRENTDGSPPGTPLWEGGNWYPTTHVELEAFGGLKQIDNPTLAEFFYEIANFNLVLNAINSSFELNVVGNTYHTDTNIVAVGMLRDNIEAISTEGRFGADAPESHTTNGISVKVYGDGSELVAAPSGWFMNLNNQGLMVFDPTDTPTQVVAEITTSMIGPPLSSPDNDPTQYVLIGKPDGWAKVPGSSRSTARIPYWNSLPTISTGTSVSTKLIGRLTGFVANPTGWIEVQPGQLTPYWS